MTYTRARRPTDETRLGTAATASGRRSRDHARSKPLVLALVRDGPLTAGALAERLGMGRTAVLRQLATLGRAGLIERRAVRHGVGRPRHLYSATPDAHGLLPTAYDGLACSLIEGARRVGGTELVDRLFDARRQVLAADVLARFADAGLERASVPDRLAELVRILDERGYVAGVSSRHGLRLHLHNCPIPAIASLTPTACLAELRLFGQVLGANVERETQLASGGTSCTYRIWARERDYPPAVWVAGQMRSGGLAPSDASAADADGGWDAGQMRTAAETSLDPPPR